MDKESSKEMSWIERTRHSLSGKTFRVLVLFSMAVSIAAISFGYYMYASSVRRDYRNRTWQMSRTANQFMDKEEALDEAAKVIYHYYIDLTEEQRDQLQDKHSPLLSIFDDVEGEGFDQLCSILRQIQENNGGRAAFTAFIDRETNRRIFIADSDPEASWCPPGSWDEFDPDWIHDITEGREYFLDELFGVGKITATMIKMEPYGFRCMAGTIIGNVDGYDIYVFYDTDMNTAVSAVQRFLWIYIALLVAIISVALLLLIRRINSNIVKPINELADAARAYTKDRNDEHRTNKHFSKLDIHTGDEIETLSQTMQEMEKDIGRYVRNLTRVTAERERIATELALANRIQVDMLPNIFPAFPDRPEFDIYALMDPAKEVGGDFYDFFLIDDDHLCMEIADVSGKGIPAALFMMASKIIIANNAMQGKTPAEILTATNELICTNNKEEMFVTVWLGILEISTGKLTACNAGHEYPVIKDPDTDFKEYKDKHGFIIGGLDKAKYRDYVIDLKPGSKIFVYTDGVVEAAESERNLFGKQRMMKCLLDNQEKAPYEILKGLRSSLDEFVNKAEQFDDITMMCMEYKGQQQ